MTAGAAGGGFPPVPMILDLIRHGEALATQPGGTDADRPLSPPGREATAQLAARLKRERFLPSLILSSPLMRARQTAALLSEAAGTDFGIAPELVPDAAPADIVAALAKRGVRDGHVVLVTHLPLVRHLACHLIGRDQLFPDGTLVRIEFTGGLEPGAGRVMRVLRPGHLG